MSEYLTDGVCLYEIVERRSVRNYGRTGGTITTVIIRDVVSEQAATIDELHLAALSAVG